MTIDATLAGPTDVAGFRAEATLLLAQQVPPDEVRWALDPHMSDGYADPLPATASRPRNVARAANAIVPASFNRLCESVMLHRDPARFALLYRLLWRLVHEPTLRNDPVDADMLQAQHMAHAVRRDIHKFKANLKLREVGEPGGGRLQLGGYEPAHHVVEATAPWFAKRLEAPRWAVFTPGRSVLCDAGLLHYGPGIPHDRLPPMDASDALWVACVDAVFQRGGSPAAHG